MFFLTSLRRISATPNAPPASTFRIVGLTRNSRKRKLTTTSTNAPAKKRSRTSCACSSAPPRRNPNSSSTSKIKQKKGLCLRKPGSKTAIKPPRKPKKTPKRKTACRSKKPSRTASRASGIGRSRPCTTASKRKRVTSSTKSVATVCYTKRQCTGKRNVGPTTSDNGSGDDVPSSPDMKRQQQLLQGLLPKTWSMASRFESPGGQKVICRRVALNSTGTEYKAVLRKVSDSRNVKQIYRIENPGLYLLYRMRSIVMQRVNGSSESAMERQLWHGTQGAAVDKICCQGFNRAFSGSKNGAVWGQGVYFTKNFSYSTHYGGGRQSFLCRVLVGRYTTGSASYIEPPVRDRKNKILYDSVVNHIQNPDIFVVFQDAQAYPEYLVIYG